jgi:hypothetical protein
MLHCAVEKAGIHLDKTGDLSFFIQQQQQKVRLTALPSVARQYTQHSTSPFFSTHLLLQASSF